MVHQRVLCCLTIYTLTSVCILSLLIPIYFLGCWKGNLFNNQELLKSVIIFFILMTLMCDSGVILWGEIIYLSLLRVKAEHQRANLLCLRFDFSPRIQLFFVLFHLSDFHPDKLLIVSICFTWYLPFCLFFFVTARITFPVRVWLTSIPFGILSREGLGWKQDLNSST